MSDPIEPEFLRRFNANETSRRIINTDPISKGGMDDMMVFASDQISIKLNTLMAEGAENFEVMWMNPPNFEGNCGYFKIIGYKSK